MAIETPERKQESEFWSRSSSQPGLTPSLEDAPSGSENAERRLGLGLTALAVFSSSAAAAWMAAGLFGSWLARPIAVLGAGIGVATVALSYRTRRPGLVQSLVLPVAIAAGSLAVFSAVPDASIGRLPGIVYDAVRAGGLAQPPVPFDPGWRFLLLVVFAVVGAASASLALALNRVHLGVFQPLPVLLAAALIQPNDGSLVASAGSLFLFAGSIALAYGAELARQEATSGKFEFRRLRTAGLALIVATGSMTLLSRAGFLFPEKQRAAVGAPTKPNTASAVPAQTLFTVRSRESGPWRLGVLDVYDKGLLIPPFDPGRLQDVARGGVIPGPARVGEVVTATFTLVNVKGHQIPGLANMQRVAAGTIDIAFDTRTQLLRLSDGTALKGMVYSVEASASPKAEQLRLSPAAPRALDKFKAAPAAPPEVVALLKSAPAGNAWDRLAYLRTGLHEKVVTAGTGQPVEIAPSRVVEMLQGAGATPYEITAAEVLLARWAGIPARLGYGYFGGVRDGLELKVRPEHAATWLEAYFEGSGWVPLTSVPPRARGSLSEGTKQANENIRPSDDLALTLYVPVKLETIRAIYEVVRYWVLVVLPFLVALVLLWRFYPTLLRAARSRRRSAWAARRGLTARMAVSYAGLRDEAHDLNVGEVHATPLEFLDAVQEDEEHVELSWLVTRSLWGDLGRDLRPEDAHAADELARSVRKRLRKAQPASTRLIGLGSIASLRRPYSSDMPNLWPVPLAKNGPGAQRQRRRRRIQTVAALASAVLLLTGAVVAAGTSGKTDNNAPIPVPRLKIPNRLAPDDLAGITLQREPSAEKDFAKAGRSSALREGKVFTLREGDEVKAYLQVVSLRPEVDLRQPSVRRQILSKTASGQFEARRIGRHRIYVGRFSDQSFRVWFHPDGFYYELLVARQTFTAADSVFLALLEYQTGGKSRPLPPISSQDVVDPRRSIVNP